MKVRLGTVPRDSWASAWRVVDEALRSMRDALERIQSKETRVATVIDTAALPVEILIDGVVSPIEVRLMRAVVQRSTTGAAITSSRLTWTWRGGQLIISAAPDLAATTRYDCVLAVME